MTYSRLAIATILFAPCAAHAMQQPKCTKADPRVCEFTYGPNEIYHVWSAPGSVIMIRLASDEKIVTNQGADTVTVDATGSDNLTTLKFKGCALPEPVFVVTHKVPTDELRSYTFQVETIPQICAKDIPAPQRDPNVAQAGYSSDNSATLDALPNLRHLAHWDDLARGVIPYLFTVRYPGDEQAKRDRIAAKQAKIYEKAQVEHVLAAAASGKAPTTEFRNDHYYGRGEPSLSPQSATDDGNTTTLLFPGHTEVPALTKLGNAVEGCGDKGEESAADFAMHGDRMVITGTAKGWCLRKNGRVYELHNASFNPVGYPTGTGTISPNVERAVKGEIPDGN